MEAEATKSGGIIQLQAWLEKNKKRILMAGGGVLLAVLALVAYANLQAQREMSAARALSEVRADRQPDGSLTPGTAEAYMHVANEYAGTRAGARALLLAAGHNFVQRNYEQSQSQFEEFLRRYPDSSFASQALLGVAANLDARQQTDLAIAKYEEVRRVHPNQPASDQAHFALARLYEDADRLEEAYAIYEEIVATHAGSGMGAEAGMRLEDLKERHPELVQTNAALASSLTDPFSLGTNMTLPGSTNLPLNIEVNPPETTPTAPVSVPAPNPEAAAEPETETEAVPTPAPTTPPNP